MARKYPRFLYSNPTNTKSPGPFIIHTLKPFIICKVFSAPFNPDECIWKKVITPIPQHTYVIGLISNLSNEEQTKYAEKIPQILEDLTDWFFHQIKNKEIIL